MRRFIKLIAASLALSFTFAGGIGHLTTSYASSQVEKIDLGVAPANVPYKEGVVRLNQSEELKNQVLKELKRLRGDMWDKNVPFTWDETNPSNQTIRSAALSVGYESKDDYVNDLVWNKDLEKIAIQRAYEVLETSNTTTRPDGTEYFTATTKNGQVPEVQVVVADYIDLNPKDFVDILSTIGNNQFYGRSSYDMLIKSNGVYVDDSRYIHRLINPYFHYFGFALINDPKHDLKVAVLVSNNEVLNDNRNPTAYVGEYRLSMGKKNSTPPSAADKARLQVKVDQARMQINTTKMLLRDYPATVANVREELEVLLKNAENLLLKAEAILKR